MDCGEPLSSDTVAEGTNLWWCATCDVPRHLTYARPGNDINPEVCAVLDGMSRALKSIRAEAEATGRNPFDDDVDETCAAVDHGIMHEIDGGQEDLADAMEDRARIARIGLALGMPEDTDETFSQEGWSRYAGKVTDTASVEWHRIRDAMPQHADHVLVYAAGFPKPFGVASRSGPGWRCLEYAWQDITHWRELPPGPDSRGAVDV